MMIARHSKYLNLDIMLVLDSSPRFVYKFIEQTIQPTGRAVSLKCVAVGNPTPTIIWKLDGFPITHSPRLV